MYILCNTHVSLHCCNAQKIITQLSSITICDYEVACQLAVDSCAHVLASIWLCASKPTAFDLTVTSPLNPSIHSEAGSVAVVRKHLAKYIHKCSELGWTCISPWGKEVASITPCHKDQHTLYGNLNMTLVWLLSPLG